MNSPSNLSESLARRARRIQSEMPRFYLGGGTAIMLKYQHRISTDLDFFSEKVFSFHRVIARLQKTYPIDRFEIPGDNLDLFIQGTKVSFIFYPFRNVDKLQDIMGIKAASDYDLFLNKVYAGGRRIVWKDPFDAAFLWNQYRWPHEKVKADFARKFPGQSYEIFLGALLDFDSYPTLPGSVREILSQMKSWAVP